MKSKHGQAPGDIEALARKASTIAASLRASVFVQPSGAFPLATNPLEKSAALFYQRTQSAFLDGYVVPGQRRFLFRYVFVPVFCKTVIAWYLKQEENPRYWLWQHGTYLLAFERLLVEMHLRKSVNLEAGVLNALADPSLDRRYWTRRFDQWREAARASYEYFIVKQSPQIRKTAQPQAAHLGTLQNLSDGELPDDLFSAMLENILAIPDAAAAFKKTAGRIKPARWGEAELDTWLIEIWPLVTEYGWNYFDIWSVANEKWDKTDCGSYESVGKFSDRCKKMLRLRLSDAGQRKQGRPKSVVEFDCPAFPPLAPQAIWIRSIGVDEEAWICGQLFTEKAG
jgi:hypothetical protein